MLRKIMNMVKSGGQGGSRDGGTTRGPGGSSSGGPGGAGGKVGKAVNSFLNNRGSRR